MNSDIVPELLDEIQKDFAKQYKANKRVVRIRGLLKSKEATYKEANEFAVECGEMLANSFSKFITPDSLPEGRLWYNIASRVLEPTLHKNYSLITDITNQVQTAFNEKNGVGFNPVTPAFDTNRLNGLVDKVSNAENYENVQWVLGEPVVNFSQAVVDDAIRDNAQFHYQAGLQPKIVRTLDYHETRTTRVGKRIVKYTVPCRWCENLAGEYDYPYVPSDVYRRHENCRCTVEYVADGKRKDVWTKQYTDNPQIKEEKQERIELQNKRELELKNRAEINRALTDDVGFDFVNNNVRKLNEELLRESTKQLVDLENRFNIVHLSTGSINSLSKQDALAYVEHDLGNPLNQTLSLCNKYFGRSADEFFKLELNAINTGWSMPCKTDRETVLRYTVTHEYGHMIQNKMTFDYLKTLGWTPETMIKFLDLTPYHTTKQKWKFYYDAMEKVERDCYNEIVAIAEKNNPEFSIDDNISKYGKSNLAEFFAEVFANSQLGAPNELGRAMIEWLKEKGY